MMMYNKVVEWLLEEDNPAIRYRTLTELLDYDSNSEAVVIARKKLMESNYMSSVMALFEIGKPYAYAHGFSALVEYGLSRRDVDIDKYVERYLNETGFADGCGEGLLLRNLVALGYATEENVKDEIAKAILLQQDDGGFPCVSNNPKIKKPNVPHKSCFQMTTGYLLLTAEMKKKNISCPHVERIIEYFLGRDVLFRHDDMSAVVKNEMGITFHPPVATRIGIHMIMYAMSVLHASDNPACKRAWYILENKFNEDGKYIIEGSLTKPYIKIEKPNKPSKWVTLYVLLAKKYMDDVR